MSLENNKTSREFGQETYSQEELKRLLRGAFEAEVKEKENELHRPLTLDERNAIKINANFMKRWHQKGKIPSLATFSRNFGSIVHLGNLLELPVTFDRVRLTFYESEKLFYIKSIRAWIKDFTEKNQQAPSRTEISRSISYGKIPNVPTTFLKHINPEVLYELLGIGLKREGQGIKNEFSEEKIFDALKLAFEQKCLLVAIEQGKAELTEEEKKHVQLKPKDYEQFRKNNLGNFPAVLTITKRIGPYWDNCLEKAGLPH
jgi:hypothetical protein